MLRPLNHLVRAGPRIPLPAFARPLAALAKPRDPEKPLRPASPWILFLQDFRADQSTKLKAKEVLSEASKKWRGMQAGEKAKYEEPAQALKAKYSEAMKSYKESGKQDAWKRDPERPKKPLTPFFKFMEEQRAAAGNPKEVVEITKSAGLKWKSLSESEKSRYAAGWAEAKEKYAAELQAYKDSGKEAKWEKRVGITALKEKMQVRIASKARTQKAKDANKAKLQKAKAVEKAKKAKETEKAKKAKEAEKAKAKKAKEAEKVKKAKAAEKAKKAAVRSKAKAKAKV
ncbi:unnamed protein product [Durusdinium trenchii]|uniref:HMG box domain-containing protein n=1 Tax=Durusdinium trenchii TaxID=1381693 RepID=A0ABP0JZ28_9DINO